MLEGLKVGRFRCLKVTYIMTIMLILVKAEVEFYDGNINVNDIDLLFFYVI